MEWLGASSLQHNGAYMFQQLSGARTQAPGKIMMLMHDRAFSNDHAKNELISFIGKSIFYFKISPQDGTCLQVNC